MSLMDRVREAAGGRARWAGLRHFTAHLLLDGALVERFEQRPSLKEIVVEGDIERRSMRISGFSPAGACWGFHPNFVTIQRDDGGLRGTRREIAPHALATPQDEAELVYLCGLAIWTCLTAPVVLLDDAAHAEDLGAWPEHGQTWQRLKVSMPEGALAFGREAVLYFGEDGLLRRTDFDAVCGDATQLVVNASAHQAFCGLTLPTLHRIVRGPGLAAPQKRQPILDLEIFDAAFD